MKITTNVKGQLAVSRAELRAFELGYIPSRPLFDTRYDLIIDDFKEIKRIQVKYADGKQSNSQGAVVVKLDYEDRQRKFHTYQNSEVDGLVVYVQKIDKLCFFPPSIFVGKRKLSIRIDKARNNQTKRVINAENYLW